jgi:hypothetical protein
MLLVAPVTLAAMILPNGAVVQGIDAPGGHDNIVTGQKWVPRSIPALAGIGHATWIGNRCQ